MKRFFKMVGITVLALSLFVTGASAAGGPPANRPYGQNQGTPCIATQEKVEVSGVVKSVGMGNWAVKLLNGKVIKVGFGPYWYLEDIGLSLKVGDNITMTGVYVNDRFVPVSVVKDGKTFTLRDSNGRPFWISNHGKSNDRGNGNCNCQGMNKKHHGKGYGRNR